MCSSIPVGHPPIHSFPSVEFAPRPVIPWCKSFLPPRANDVPCRNTPTPTAAVLKLPTLQSTIQPNPCSAASAGLPSQHDPFKLHKPNFPAVTAANIALFVKWGHLYSACHDKLDGHLNERPPSRHPPSRNYLESPPWKQAPSDLPDKRMPSPP